MTTQHDETPDGVIEVYLHAQGTEELRIVAVSPDSNVSGLLAAEDAEDGEMLWLADRDDPLDAHARLSDSGVTHRCHVHRARCRSVEVRVRFNGRQIDTTVPPGTRVVRVFGWAVGAKGFDLSGEEIPRHVLTVRGQAEWPDAETHVGSLTVDGCCEVDFDLVPRERYAG